MTSFDYNTQLRHTRGQSDTQMLIDRSKKLTIISMLLAGGRTDSRVRVCASRITSRSAGVGAQASVLIDSHMSASRHIHVHIRFISEGEK